MVASIWCKMQYFKKEENKIRVNFNFDKKRYNIFHKEIAKLGKKLEAESNENKLDYTVVVNGVKVPDMHTGGWTNRTEDFKFILFLDFDNTLFWQVQTQLEFLMERFDLSCFYVFQTESKIDSNGEEYGGYNCVCLTKKRFFEIFEIQNETTCDQAHKQLPKIYRFHSHVLRNLPKGKKGRPEFKCIIGDTNKEYNQPISTAHLNLMNQMYSIPQIKYSNPDNYTNLWLAEYSTASP